MLWGSVGSEAVQNMMKPASGGLRYHSEAHWSLRKVVFVVASVSLAIWGVVLLAVLG
jgi:hypothetical protein